jgi:hypothetical protein
MGQATMFTVGAQYAFQLIKQQSPVVN